MMNPIKKNPLGRGLESLIPRSPSVGTQENATETAPKDGRLMDIDITDIRPNDNQPRRDFDAEGLKSLAESIKSKGLMQPLVVTKLSGEDGKYMLIAGERRWRASAMAGLRNVPAVVMPCPEENDRLELALIENTQRDDLKPLELARAYQSLMDRCGYRQEDVAQVAGKSRSAVANTLRLLDLSETVMAALEKKEITEGHARAFLPLEEDKRKELLAAVLGRSLSVRQTEALAKQLAKGGKPKEKPEADSNMGALVDEMKRYFGTNVSMKQKGKSKESGIIEIKYSSNDELNRIIELIRK